jgi:transaldolase
MPPAVPAPPPPIAYSRAMGMHGCRSRPAIRTRGTAHERDVLKSGRDRGDNMKATRILHDLGQSLWLDNITRNLLRTGVLRRYIDEFSVTGLTSNPTIFDHAIKNSGDYDDAIKSKLAEGKSGEKLFFELALEDLTQAADLFRPVYDRTGGVDGWVSLEVSPLLAHDTKSTIAVAKDLHAQARRPNVLIKIPGTPEGLPAIEEAIFAGVPINVTLLFSDDQYLAAANAFMRGIERRIEAGLKPDVRSVASVFISRWDVAVTGKVPEALNDRLGIAIAKRTYKAYLGLLSSPRWMRAYNAGARPQRLLWASTGTKDPKASDVLYVKALAAPFTVNTMPEGTLKALAEHGDVGATIPADGGDSEEELARFAEAKIDVHALAKQLQDEGAKSFVNSWNDLMGVISSKSAVLKRAS